MWHAGADPNPIHKCIIYNSELNPPHRWECSKHEAMRTIWTGVVLIRNSYVGLRHQQYNCQASCGENVPCGLWYKKHPQSGDMEECTAPGDVKNYAKMYGIQRCENVRLDLDWIRRVQKTYAKKVRQDLDQIRRVQKKYAKTVRLHPVRTFSNSVSGQFPCSVSEIQRSAIRNPVSDRDYRLSRSG